MALSRHFPGSALLMPASGLAVRHCRCTCDCQACSLHVMCVDCTRYFTYEKTHFSAQVLPKVNQPSSIHACCRKPDLMRRQVNLLPNGISLCKIPHSECMHILTLPTCRIDNTRTQQRHAITLEMVVLVDQQTSPLILNYMFGEINVDHPPL